jgi:hypothetical protein
VNNSPPTWDPLIQTLRAAPFPNDPFPGGLPNHLMLWTSDRQLDELVLTIAVRDGTGFVLGQVPEPGTLLLLGMGLAGLAFMRRRST